MQDFIGEGGALDNPEVIYRNLPEPDISDDRRHGVEAVSAMAFETVELMPGKEASYVIVAGITDMDDSFQIAEKYNSVDKFDRILEETRNYWSKLSDQVSFKTGQPEFDEWVKWLAFQLKCRQIFGNSFLPDFGYGRGGRGWRDLWQDSLSIFLVDPDSARDEIINNLRGIRIDGSNATIIGDNPGEFKADRNNIPRTWCDHGAWPLFALNFYIQQTGDFEILLENIPYWKDQFINRSGDIDELWSLEDGTWLKTDSGDIYTGTVLEHVLIQQFSAFYNVGEHNVLKLEGADWNDTLDMARNRGESVCFQSFYAGNLEILIDLLNSMKSQGIKSVLLLNEITEYFKEKDFESSENKLRTLNKYFEKVRNRVSGKQKEINLDELIEDIKEKYKHSSEQVREKEWMQSSNGNSFFNGHYDDRGLRMHGDFKEGTRMDLTSQVMPVMCNIADDNQIDSLYKSAREILGTSGEPGLRLCTKYPDVDMNIGRITGFVYGYKEHGSKWMQQNIMFMYGLFKRGKLDYGHEMLQDILSISQNSSAAKTFPGIASFYEPDNRGAYMYLTGSSTWIFLSLLTQIFGVRGEKGDLLINPKLSDWFFDENGEANVQCAFQNQRISLTYINKQSIPTKGLQISKVEVDGKLFYSGKSDKVQIDQAYIRAFDKDLLYIEVSLG
jgi:cellobiose phosphorylase